MEFDAKKSCVTLDVKNTGSVAGMETVQIYVRKKNDENAFISTDINKNTVCTAYPELRGFEKVRLEAGETAQVKIILDENSFKTYDTACHTFIEQPGEYEIMAAKSIRKIEQKVIVKLEKSTAAQENCIQHSNDNSDYTPDEELYTSFFTDCRVNPHHKGTFTTADNLGDMAKESFYVKMLLFFIEQAMVVSSHGKSRNDPSVKIAISALRENPLESLISTSGGALSQKFVEKIVQKANGK